MDGKVMVKGQPAKALTWKAACQKLGVNSISETGANVPAQAAKEGLNTGGVGGVQIADVSVDMETGIVKMNRLIAVQDIGLVVNPKTAESQVYGACIMSICGALMEERIMDAVTGKMLNADMEFYKLAGIKDIGEIVVHLEVDETNDTRGVIGLGRTAGNRRHRSHRQRRDQRHRRPATDDSDDPDERAERPRGKGRNS